MNDDIKLLGLQRECAIFRNIEGLHMGKRVTLAQQGRN